MRLERIRRETFRLREKYGIPKKGFKKLDLKLIEERCVFYAPRDWKYAEDNEKKRELTIELRSVLSDFQLRLSPFWKCVFRVHIFHESEPSKLLTIVSKAETPGQNSDLLLIENLVDTLGEYPSDMPRLVSNHFENIASTHPIALYISPDIKITALKDLIDANKDLIEFLQERVEVDAKLRIGDSNARGNRIFNSTILAWHEQGYSGKEIAELAHKKFGSKQRLSPNHISMIVYRERKKQHKV